MGLKIVAWNCCGGLKGKAARISELNADIAVIAEVLREHAPAIGQSYSWVWDGDEGQKGLLLLAREPWRIELIRRSTARHTVHAEASLEERRVAVIGVWAMAGNAGYVDTVTRGLDELLPSIACEDIIVAGDFNASPIFDRADRLGNIENGFEQILGRMRARELESAWHVVSGDPVGGESVPTYHHRRKRDEGFHIDYVFLSPGLRKRLTSVDIGRHGDWCVPIGGSDHMPIVVRIGKT